METEVSRATVEKGKDVDNVVITYSDGTTRKLSKCMIIENGINEDEEDHIEMHCLKLSGQEVIYFMQAVAEALLMMGGDE